ncbi:MAG: LysR family transcriptional regulator [Rhodospirillales bacterium]|jgi:hypothetical protein|nr:LysR family transcriptional regulator [Rhodospirillales bacterium]MBT4040220.1 LysR family transcriptional regulator [Rhodospirillales bacterium]MBT4627949.1 LysR family transcriptional regulator [Rhodospirillales bacterium]MBT5350312.1 LysR family transcriptional regulator [Rhodospirillales bacterium]MBT5521315.1 LysR family transcriptional regulator [Rhodospirillales bacterium]
MPQPHSHAILFEMLRSFTTLAHTLNLSKAVRVLGSTRQTVRRHIDILEDIRGEKLFKLQDRQYNLTEAGSQSLHEAEILLSRGEAWLTGRTKTVGGLALVRYDDEQKFSTYLQQHPVTRIWDDGPPLLQAGAQSWVDAKARLDHPAMERITPYINVFRKHEENWLCVHVGEKSSIARLLGPTWAKSAIGVVMTDDPIKSDADSFSVEIYNRVALEGGLRLDHIFVGMAREEGQAPQPIRYQRLLFGCYFPDGSPALANLTALTNKIDIAKLDLKNVGMTPEEDLMEFDI